MTSGEAETDDQFTNFATSFASDDHSYHVIMDRSWLHLLLVGVILGLVARMHLDHAGLSSRWYTFGE